MNPDDDERNWRRRRKPFDFFGIDDDFDEMFREMERMMERLFRGFSYDKLPPGKSFVHGFTIRVGPDGKPKMEEFGNRPLKDSEGEPLISDEREPLTDIIEGNEEVSVTVEIPGVDKQDINLNVEESTLEITVDSPHRKYHKIVDLPCDVQPKTTKATYKNGVLDVVIRRKDKKKKGEGYKVNID